MTEQGCPHGPLVAGVPCFDCIQERAAADEEMDGKMQQLNSLVAEIKKLEGERPDAAPPKVPLKDVLKQDKIIEIDKDGKVHLPAPPSDAAQLEAARSDIKTFGRAVYYPNAHPEDAPEGPWEIFKSEEGWNVTVPGDFHSWTEKEAIAVRDLLNRLKGDRADG